MLTEYPKEFTDIGARPSLNSVTISSGAFPLSLRNYLKTGEGEASVIYGERCKTLNHCIEGEHRRNSAQTVMVNMTSNCGRLLEQNLGDAKRRAFCIMTASIRYGDYPSNCQTRIGACGPDGL